MHPTYRITWLNCDAAMRLAFCIAILISLSFTCVQGQNPTLLPAKFNNKWGFINEKGEWALQPIYDQCLPFDGRDYTWVQFNNEQVLINQSGIVELKLPFSNIVSIQADLIIYRKDQLFGWLNRKTQKHVHPAFRKLDFVEASNQFLFEDSYGFGVVDVNGDEIIEPRFDHLGLLGNYYITSIKNKSGLIDFEGHRIISDSFNMIYLVDNYIVGRNQINNYCVFDTSGKMVFSGEFNRLNHLTGSFFEVANRKSTYLMNANTGQPSDSMALRYSHMFGEYIFIHRDSTVGLFSATSNRILFPVEFAQIFAQNGSSNFILVKNGLSALYDSIGNSLTNHEYEIISEFRNGGSCMVRKNQQWGIINRKGKEVLNCRCDFLSLDEDNIAKCKTPKQVALFEFDENQKIVDSVVFTNAATLNLGGVVSMSTTTTGAVPNQSISEYWFMDKAGRWGLKDSAGNIFLKPFFTEVRKIIGTNYVLCSSPYQKNLSTVKDLQVVATKQFALIDEVGYRKMTPSGIIYVDEASVMNNNHQVFRIMYANGFCASVNKATGKLMNYNSKYIGPFVNGYAKVFVSTYVFYAAANRKYIQIQTLPAHLREFNLQANQSMRFSGLDFCGAGYWAYIGTDGVFINTPSYFKEHRFQAAHDFKNDRAIVMNGDSLFGLIDQKGEIVLSLVYKKMKILQNTNDSLLVMEIHHPRFGYVDVNGKVISFPQFSKANDFSGGMAWAHSDRKTMLLNRSGVKREFEGYMKTVPFSEGMSGIAMEHRFALIDSNGEQTTDFLFSKIEKCSEGLIPLRRKGGYGFADNNGNFVISANYKKAQPFSGGLAAVRIDKEKKSLYGFIDKQGVMVVPAKYNRVKNLDSNGFAEVKKGNKVGMINSKGDLVVRAKYKKVFYGDGVLVATNGMSSTIFSTEGKKINTVYAKVRYAPTNGAIVLSRRGKTGAVDLEGERLLWFKYVALQPFEKEVSVMQMGRNCGIVNKSGDTLTTVPGRAVGGFSSEFLLVKYEGFYQFVNASGKNVFNKKFNHAEPFNNNFAIVREGKKYGLIDQNGYYRIMPNYDKIKDPQDGVCIVEQHNLMGVTDLNGKFVIAPECNNIKYDETNLVFQYSKNNHLGYFDRSGKMIWSAE